MVANYLQLSLQETPVSLFIFLANAEEKGEATVSLLIFIFCLFFPLPSPCSLFF